MLFKFGLVDSPHSIIIRELETSEHFLFHCEKVNTFWNELNTILKSQDLVITNFDIKDLLFGHFCSVNDDSILVNYIIILESKYLIFRSKLLSKSSFSTSLLLAKCIKTYQIERFIANKNNKLHFHNKKM